METTNSINYGGQSQNANQENPLKKWVIILGAFGCGAFKNKPEVVALAAKNVIKDYLHAFKVIEYAVYCRPNDDRNYKVFERVLKPLSRV